MGLFKKLNQRGFSHHALIAIVVVGVAVIGTYLLVASHADQLNTEAPLAFVQRNTSSNLTSITTLPIGSAGLSNAVSYGAQYSAIGGPNSSYEYGAPTYSSDGKFIAYYRTSTSSSSYNYLQFYDLATAKTTQAYLFPTIQLGTSIFYVAPAWFPSDNEVVFAAGNSNSATGQENYLYTSTIGATGGTLGTVSQLVNVGSSQSITSVAVTGNGAYIVYSTATGVYSITPTGTTPSTIFSAPANSSCSDAIAQPGTTNGIAFECGNNIYKAQVSQSSPTEIFNGSPSTTLNYDIKGMTWSPSGSLLGLNLTKETGSLTYCPSVTFQNMIVSLPNGGGNLTTIQSSPATVGTGCKGGGGPINNIAWSPNGDNIAYIEGYNQGNTDLYNVLVTPGGSTPVIVSSTSIWVTW